MWYTWFHDNNYEIGNDESGKIAFITLAADAAILKNSQLYQKPYFAVTSDTWHCRIGHIGPLELHMLIKEYLRVQLQDKKMFQCTHYIVSKIFEQVSRRPLANQSMRRVYINWLDLEKGWDSYKGGGTMMRRLIVTICEAIRMTVTYFTQLVEKSENLFLTQNLLIGLQNTTICM